MKDANQGEIQGKSSEVKKENDFSNWKFIKTTYNEETDKFEKEFKDWQEIYELADKAHKEKPNATGYEASEHFEIGNKGFNDFSEGVENALTQDMEGYLLKDAEDLLQDKKKKWVFKFTDGLMLQPGHIVALAGDFYGVIGTPISSEKLYEEDKEIEARFEDAYNTLCKADTKEVVKILKIIAQEHRVVEYARAKGYKPYLAFSAIGNSGNHKFARVSRYSNFAPSLLSSKYMSLAKDNFDHFGDNARKAFRAGLNVARKTLDKRANEKDDKIRGKLYKDAFCQLLFACHFLTDLFAAGHMRTPRRELRAIKGIGATTAGILAKAMHDEENKSSLLVRSGGNRDVRKAYGDKCAFLAEQEPNYKEAIEVVKVVLNQLDEYAEDPESKIEEKDSWDQYIPTPLTQEECEKLTQEEREKLDNKSYHHPLFKVAKGGEVLCRTGSANLPGNYVQLKNPRVYASYLLVTTFFKGKLLKGLTTEEKGQVKDIKKFIKKDGKKAKSINFLKKEVSGLKDEVDDCTIL
ncbi:MAG: hypothetical protein COC15_04215 [Legionellales bacterium]|nr:MAG: hypothetical protein COC15_04215 [Legionellales bacterium]